MKKILFFIVLLINLLLIGCPEESTDLNNCTFMTFNIETGETSEVLDRRARCVHEGNDLLLYEKNELYVKIDSDDNSDNGILRFYSDGSETGSQEGFIRVENGVWYFDLFSEDKLIPQYKVIFDD